MVAKEHEYLVMPGGLTRVAPEKDELVVSNQSGGMSKDTWILAAEPEKPVSVWSQQSRYQMIDAVTEPLTSRAADNLFWVGRYLERVEASTRLLRTVLLKLSEVSKFDEAADLDCLAILLSALTHVTTTYPGFVTASEKMVNAPQMELLSIVKDSQRSGSLTVNIHGFVQSAFSIRDIWSQDTWRTVDNIRRRWQQRVAGVEVTIEQLQIHLDDLINGLVAFTGLITESMTRDAGWLMLDSGRRLERALTLISLLRATLVIRQKDEALLNQMLEAVLISTDSLTIYLRRYRSAIQLPMVLELLLIDETHPRSVAYQLNLLNEHIKQFPRERHRNQLSQEERLILKAYTDIRLCTVIELLKISKDGVIYAELDEILLNTVKLLWQTAEVIAQAFFSHSQISQLVSAPTVPENEL